MLTVLAVYVLLYGWMLISSDFVPYVMDGNESYSSLVHAYNLYHFDITKSAGLTDEAASPDPVAHPFSYTHQGNFPRLFAYLIYLLGAREIESQIAITTATVGLATIMFAFTFFCRISGPILAAVYALTLMTDYVLFSQWEVQTARVWNGFFMFSSLLCAQGIGGRRRLMWAVLTILNHICLFYFQLLFACFAAVTTGLYTGWLYRRNWKTVALGWGVQIGGMVISLCIMAAQLVLYLGWDDFLQDLYLTFMARSYASRDPAWLKKLTDFYETRNIVFWYNLRSEHTHAGFSNFWRSIFGYGFLIHTPFLTLIVFLIVTGWMAGIAASSIGRLRVLSSFVPSAEFKALVVLAVLVAFGLYILFSKLVIEDPRLTGQLELRSATSLSGLTALTVMSLLFVGLITALIVRQAWNAFAVDGKSPVAKVLVAGLFLIGAGGFSSFQSLLYKQEWRILWADKLGPSNYWIALVVVCSAIWFGLLLINLTPARVLNRGNAEARGTLVFLMTGLVAFVVAYRLAPGYIHSGYLELYTPLLVFQVDCLFATAFFLVLSAARSAYAKVKTARSLGQADLVKAWATQPAMTLCGSAGLAGYVLVFWIGLQIAYVRLFPTDTFVFMKMLREPPYRGKSFVVNNYAIPTFAYTGQWAYYDSIIEKGILNLTTDGYNLQRDLRELWFADRYTRPDYLKPDYFLCITGRNFHTIVASLASGGARASGCDTLELVKQASSDTATVLHHRIVDQDTSPDKLWAVVKLDWDFPPFLEASDSESGGAPVQLMTENTPTGWEAVVKYRYRHQEDTPEGDTQVRLFSIEPVVKDALHSQEASENRMIGEGIRQRRFLLPRNFEGFLQATVTPATLSKVGPQYTSEQIWASARDQKTRQEAAH